MKTSLSKTLFFSRHFLHNSNQKLHLIRPHPQLFFVSHFFWPNSRPRPWHQSKYIETKNEILVLHVVVDVDVVAHVVVVAAVVVRADKETSSQIFNRYKEVCAWVVSKHVRVQKNAFFIV